MRAQRLQLAGKEAIPIATVRFHVVGNGCDSRNAAAQAKRAERLFADLGLPDAAPSF
jgi:hypothetical protein